MAYVTANGKDLAITSLETITCFDPSSGDYLFTLDELQGATISQTETSIDVVGRNGRLISRIKRNKGVTVSGRNGLVSGGLLARQVGSNFEHGGAYIMWSEYITISSNAADNVTRYTAVGSSGSEIAHLFVKGNDGTISRELTQSSTPSGVGIFSYNPSTKLLSFYPGDVPAGTEVVVMYKRFIIADVLKNRSGRSSGEGQLYIDAFAEDKCSNVYRIQFFFPRVSFSGEFSFDIGENQVIHEFEAVAESGACGSSMNYFTYTVFGENEDDESLLVRFVTGDGRYFASADEVYFSTMRHSVG